MAIENHTAQTEGPRTESLLSKFEDADVLTRALLMGLAAMGEIQRVRTDFEFIESTGRTPDDRLKPAEINATDVPTEEIFSHALTIADLMRPSYEDLSGALRKVGVRS